MHFVRFYRVFRTVVIFESIIYEKIYLTKEQFHFRKLSACCVKFGKSTMNGTKEIYNKNAI